LQETTDPPCSKGSYPVALSLLFGSTFFNVDTFASAPLSSDGIEAAQLTSFAMGHLSNAEPPPFLLSRAEKAGSTEPEKHMHYFFFLSLELSAMFR
jgi:hypothetical protein